MKENEARFARLLSLHHPGHNEQQLINLIHFSKMRKTSVIYVIQNVSTRHCTSSSFRPVPATYVDTFLLKHGAR